MSTAKVTVLLDESIAQINPLVYGHFAEHLGACIYEGIWVGEDSTIPNIDGIRRDVVDALAKIRPSVVRWPGGCFADNYHWQDGIGPRNERPRRVNIWWAQDIETNEFGTHEFIQFCRLIGAEPYICGNVGSGTPRQLREWVEYCNFAGDSTLTRMRAANGSPEPFGVKYWGVGNENWGCGGNFCPEDYAAEYKRFATYLHDMGDTSLFLIACGPRNNDADWTNRFFEKLGDFRRLHGYAAHYYTRSYQHRTQTYVAGTATEYTADEWYLLLHLCLEMEPLIREQRALLDEVDPEREIGLIVDEWGAWHAPDPDTHPRHLRQQNTMRDALVAAASLDIFNRHADKITMSNIAQTINVLQAMVLTDGDRMLTTPTYHVYDMYQTHQGGQSVRTEFEVDDLVFAGGEGDLSLPGLSGSASVKDGMLTLSLVNPSVDAPVEIEVELRGGETTGGKALTLADDDIHAHNTFDAPTRVQVQNSQVDAGDSTWRYTASAASVTVLQVNLG